MKVTTLIRIMFTPGATHSTATIMAAITPHGFSLEQISGGIGYLRSKGQLSIVSVLPYGHIFA